MAKFNRNQLQRLFGRLLETNPCPKHGVEPITICSRCDVAYCSTCGKCGCVDASETATRAALRELWYWLKGELKFDWPRFPHHLRERIDAIVKTPEEE